MEKHDPNTNSAISTVQKTLILLSLHHLWSGVCITVEPDLIAAKMLAFPSKSSRDKNDSDLEWEDNSYIRCNGRNFYSKFQR